MKQRLAGAALALVLLVGAVPTTAEHPAAAQAPLRPFVPAQFVARTYLEALGRLPDQAGFDGAVEFFTRSGCSATTLRTWALVVWTAPEHERLRHPPAARLLAAYRAVLLREPDPAALTTWLPQLGAGLPFGALVRALFDSSEFTALAGELCSSRNVLPRPAPAIDVLAPALSQAEVQAALDATVPGGSVFLPPGTVVRLTRTLVVPEGVTLQTCWSPTDCEAGASRRRVAAMARLVREAPGRTWQGPIVELRPGAGLRYVWVDGRRSHPGDSQERAVTVLASLGVGPRRTIVERNRLDAGPGAQVLRLGDTRSANLECPGMVARENLIIASTSSSVPHPDGRSWVDGIFSQCQNGEVVANEVLDASDVGLIEFIHPGQRMNGLWQRNRVLNVGNDAFAALAVDPFAWGREGEPSDFSGTRFVDNTLWTGPDVQYLLAIAAGTRPWDLPGLAAGATFTGNGTGTSRARATTFLSVNGLHDGVVEGNEGEVELVPPYGNSTCEAIRSIAHPTAASGRLQEHAVGDNRGCVRP